MRSIARELHSATTDLFHTGRDRLVVLGLVALAAFVSVAELLTAHIFSTLIIPVEPSAANSDLLLQGLALILVFALLRLIGYAQSVYRVTVFDRAFARTSSAQSSSNPWRWAQAMELVSLLMFFGRVLVIAAGLFLFSVGFAVANLVALATFLWILGLSVRKQYESQRKLRKLQREGAPPSNAERVRVRIKAGEFTSLLSGALSVGLISLLILQFASGRVAAAPAVVIFLAVRMTSTLYASISTGFMRLVRARVYCE